MPGLLDDVAVVLNPAVPLITLLFSPLTKPVRLAVKAGFTAPYARLASCAVTVSPFLFTVKLWSTDVAASRLPVPARLARTVTTPAPVKVS